jgi:D-3-phosphoglycerate dehydrogenase / 2-oxoglutarate reductase
MGTVDALILDLLEWIGPDPEPYAETLDAWRTSCPRRPVWEDASDRGLITRHRADAARAGLDIRRRHRTPPHASPALR